jgi:hypothetical protein
MYYKGFITVLDFGHAEKEESFAHPKKDKIMKYINEFLAGKNAYTITIREIEEYLEKL